MSPGDMHNKVRPGSWHDSVLVYCNTQSIMSKCRREPQHGIKTTLSSGVHNDMQHVMTETIHTMITNLKTSQYLLTHAIRRVGWPSMSPVSHVFANAALHSATSSRLHAQLAIICCTGKCPAYILKTPGMHARVRVQNKLLYVAFAAYAHLMPCRRQCCERASKVRRMGVTCGGTVKAIAHSLLTLLQVIALEPISTCVCIKSVVAWDLCQDEVST